MDKLDGAHYFPGRLCCCSGLAGNLCLCQIHSLFGLHLPRYHLGDRIKALGCVVAVLTYAVWQG